MYKQFFSGMEWTFLPLFALAVFLVVFAVVVLRVLVIQKRSDLDVVAALPLHEGTQVNFPAQAPILASEVKS